MALCYSRRPSAVRGSRTYPPEAHAGSVSSQSFPHLWKKLWKFHRIWRYWGLIGRNLAETGDVAVAKVGGRPWSGDDMNLWEQILARVETKVNRHSFYTWFKPTTFIGADSRTISVRVPNPLFKDWLTKHYSGIIAEALGEGQKPGLDVSFLAEPHPEAALAATAGGDDPLALETGATLAAVGPGPAGLKPR